MTAINVDRILRPHWPRWKSPWSFAHVVRRDHMNRSRNADQAATTCERFILFYSQNNKIVWLSNMADTFLEKFTRCAKVCGLFFLIVLFGCWLAEQTKLRSRESDLITIALIFLNWNHLILFFPLRRSRSRLLPRAVSSRQRWLRHHRVEQHNWKWVSVT